jgi:hypothetical protein
MTEPDRRQQQIDAAVLAQLRAQLAKAEARGWAAAVEALRDDGRFVTWLGAQPFDDRQSALGPARLERRSLADYLDAVAPGRPGAPDGATP